HPARAGRAQGVPRGDPRRPRLDRRRGRRRADRRCRREPRRRLSRPLCRGRHQGFCAVRADDHHTYVQALRHLRATSDRAGVTGKRMFHREAGNFKTTYAADMAVFPLPIARWTVLAILLLFAVVFPATLDDYYLSIINLVLIAVVGALGLNILVGNT